MFRKALGKINWVAGMARPEINYHIGKISAKVKNGTPADVHTINKAIKYIKNMPLHITVPVLDSSSLEYNYTLMQVSITCQMAEVKEVCNILM